jgi:sulfane dehydrogenase subunit SoxC
MKPYHQILRPSDFDNVAGNGLVDRRLFLTGSAVAGVAASGVAFPDPATADPLAIESWMKVPGSPLVAYGQPSRFEDKVVRVAANPPNAPGTGAARTPLHRLNGTITPNGLHFERSYSGIPASPRTSIAS